MKNKFIFNTLSLKQKKLNVDNKSKMSDVCQESTDNFQLKEKKIKVNALVINKTQIQPKILTEDEEDRLLDVLKEKPEESKTLQDLFLFPLEEVIKICLNNKNLVATIKKLNHFFKSKQTAHEDFFELVSDIDVSLKETINAMTQLNEADKKIAQAKLLYMLNCFQNKLEGDRECESIQKQKNEEDENGYMIMKGGVNPSVFFVQHKEVLNDLPPPLPHRNTPGA